MINFSKISNKSIIGKLLRLFLKIIPNNTILPIFQGRLKWKRWIRGSGMDSYWLGNYELEKVVSFEENIKKGDVIFDIGAQSGFYTLLASELTGEDGKVFSFEPFPQNIYYLKRNTEINNCKNINVIEMAVSDKNGIVNFKEGKSNFAGRISDEGDLKVKTASIDVLMADGKLLPPNLIKIDVEGAEFSVLKGARLTLEKYHPLIFLAIHRINENIHKDCCDFLKSIGYKLKAMDKIEIEKSDEIIAY